MSQAETRKGELLFIIEHQRFHKNVLKMNRIYYEYAIEHLLTWSHLIKCGLALMMVAGHRREQRKVPAVVVLR